MELFFDRAAVSRGGPDIRVSGRFGPGINLVSGRVGSGKSTVAAMAAGLLAPGEGAVIRKGIRSSMISFQFPEWQVTGNTIREEIKSWGADEGEILLRAGLVGREGDDPLSLSRGELKRLVLSCIFGKAWDLLILDEPFGALDCSGKREICRWIEARRSSIVVLCTHEQRFLPRTDFLWEFQGHDLVCRGTMPAALGDWELAPPFVKALLSRGIVPHNISEDDLAEAACRIHG
jgi:energy-coupling factor transport system ATP-binding protein